MPQVTVCVKHHLGKEEAIRRIRSAVDNLKHRVTHTVSDIQESWTDGIASFSFRILKMSIEGTLNVEPLRVELRGRFPAAVLPFKKEIEKDIERKARRLLA